MRFAARPGLRLAVRGHPGKNPMMQRHPFRRGENGVRGLLFLLAAASAACAPVRGPFTGIDALTPEESAAVDEWIAPVLGRYRYLNVALVRSNEVVLTRSYGRNRLDEVEDYASVSKPVTAMLLFQLLEEGAIASLDDALMEYLPGYAERIPEEYAGHPITLRHLLSHQSGIRHLGDTWRGGTLNLAFAPGSAYAYSTDAFGVLGEVIEALRQQPYADAVRTRIGLPAGAASFGALDHFLAPGGNVHSTIGDMARFAAGVMTNAYVSAEAFGRILAEGGITNRNGLVCLGWYYHDLGTPDLALFHTGSNGRPRAYLRLLPEQGAAVAMTGLARSEDVPFDLDPVGLALLDVLAGAPAHPRPPPRHGSPLSP